MRCKKHITDGSSRVGVCASCLRERLFALVEAQARSAAVQQQIDHHEDHRKSDPLHNYSSHPHQQQQPPPLIFPRSVSPYICRRPDNNNNDSSWQHHQNQNSRFYSTPQLGPNTNPLNDTANTTISSSSAVHKKKNRFRILSNLFRSSHRSVVVIDEQEPIPDPNSTVSRASLSTSSPISSSTWYSSLIPNRTRKTTQESPCRSTTNHHHHRPHRNKGLSPNYTEQEEDNIGGDEEDINNIGYVSESSPGWRKSAATTPGRQRKGGQNGNHNSSKSVSMAFCLSPLVRASPKRPSRNQKDTGFSGEIRVSSSVHNLSHHNPNLSTAASFCANRSRKIANFGRYNNNYNP
ncbi:hypothetical protein MKW94_018468 [Papaver nudicaule]|uniref:Uncharacterized protein n=1 Tax=Papaver nudicaule TaxID=74823 RepID=A0AA41VHM3_PAPNU|nr:hypothetical protein [Papaver nudicaule]